MAPSSDKGLKSKIRCLDSRLKQQSGVFLLLTQVVENHEFVQGRVEVSVSGMIGRTRIFALNELDEDKAHPYDSGLDIFKYRR